MRSIVTLTGQAPAWVERHAEAVATRLADDGEVTLVIDRPAPLRLPGELPPASAVHSITAGRRVRVGNLTAALGLRPRCDVVVMIAHARRTSARVLVAAAICRLRGEKVVLDVQDLGDRSARVPAARRLLARLCTAVVEPSPVELTPRVGTDVVALCGDDERFANLIASSFGALSRVVEWNLRLVVDANIAPAVDVRRPEIVVDPSPLDPMSLSDAIVLAAHDSSGAMFAGLPALRSAGVLVGHPLAGRVARRGDGTWLARPDPSSILVALESAVRRDADRPTTATQFAASSERVVNAARALV